MKTICVKTNNFKAIHYLLENLKQLDLNDVDWSMHKFKVYHNIFIHYKGDDLSLFLSTISEILSSLVVENYEDIITKKILQHEYFYFDVIERNEIFEKIKDNSYFDSEGFINKKHILFNRFYDFLTNEQKLYLKGFITFRLKDYSNELEKQVDIAVNQYLIEKEYLEFVSLLKMYVNSEISNIDTVHLIYNADEPILLDKNKNIIKTDINSTGAKYLSDITFSSCDMILNTLLNLIPKKIYIHLINEEDDFINTLKLIFDNRIQICTNCDICRLYKKNLTTTFVQNIKKND